MSPATRFLVEDALKSVWGAALVALVFSALGSRKAALGAIVALGTVGLVLYQTADREGYPEPERD